MLASTPTTQSVYAIIDYGDYKSVVEMEYSFGEYVVRSYKHDFSVIFTSENSLTPEKENTWGLENDEILTLDNFTTVQKEFKVVKAGHPIAIHYGDEPCECSTGLSISFDSSRLSVYSTKKRIEPKHLYLIGSMQGWWIEDGSIELTNLGDNDFYGEFDVNESEPIFRFYTMLGDWNRNSIGAVVADVAFPVDTYPYNGDIVDGKGAWQLKDWEYDILCLHINLPNRTIEISGKSNTGISDAVSDLQIVLRGVCLETSQDCDIHIFNLAGTSVLATFGRSVDISSLPPGIYIARAGAATQLIRR